ncbi:MAG TPA: phospholipase D-like domain-containing protein [Acidimicrobiales bacterium]
MKSGARTFAALLFVVAGLAASIALPAGADTVTSVTRVWVEPDGGYRFIDAAIEAARSSIDLSMYELSDPTIEADLVAAARRGVDVRVILNADYDGKSANESAMAVLRAGSVHVIWAPPDQIYHAKYLVVDNSDAYIGTGNFVRSDYDSTRDFWVSVTQRAQVSAVVATFDSNYAGGVTTRQANGLVWSPGSSSPLIRLISSARRSLLVENEEMDSTPIEDALATDARRGVVVEVAMTEDSEWTAALERLASAGVHVRLLSSSQVYVHAKIICADCASSAGAVFIGSENFSTSSLDYNRELGVITSTRAVVNAVRSAAASDFAHGSALRAPPSGAPVSSSGGVTITSLIASIAPGGYESLAAATPRPGQDCTLTVVLPSGYTSGASGLGEATTNAQGRVSWNWRIGTSTDPGTASLRVSCATGNTNATFTIT